MLKVSTKPFVVVVCGLWLWFVVCGCVKKGPPIMHEKGPHIMQEKGPPIMQEKGPPIMQEKELLCESPADQALSSPVMILRVINNRIINLP